MSTATFTCGEQPTVMITTPDEEMRARFASRAPAAGWRVVEASSAAEALLQLDARSCRAVIIDHSLPDLHAAELAQMVRSEHSTVDVCMVDSATEMIQRDAFPCRPETERLLQALASEPDEQVANTREAEFEPLPKMMGASASVRRVARMVRLVAPRNTTVLVTGASGTGKELVARAIHDLSPRTSGPFVVVNCAAIPETLIEAELFGYAKGAFTGAVQSRMGRVSAAHAGTLFLDEISELPLGMQAKLLRFLQNGEIQRLGCTDVFRVDVRVVASSNCALSQRVSAGAFRDDPYYRIAVFPIGLPLLRERGKDVVLLAAHFLKSLCYASSIPRKRLSSEAMALLRQHSWPGNVRELQHAIERALILSGDDETIRPEHLLFDVDLNAIQSS